MSTFAIHPVEGARAAMGRARSWWAARPAPRRAAEQVRAHGAEIAPVGRGWAHMVRATPGQATLGLMSGLGEAAATAAHVRAGRPLRRYLFEVGGLLAAWDEPFLRQELEAEARAGHPARVRVS